MRKASVSFLIILVAINALSLALVSILKHTSEKFSVWENFRSHKIYSDMVLLPKDYAYHPFLGYEARQKETAESSLKADYKVAVVGGSFADYFAKTIIGQNHGVYSFEDARGKTVTLSFTNLALGGYRQPQQLIASVLNLDDYDLFLSFEGFNELFVSPETCAPADWPLLIHVFDPDLQTPYKKMADLVRGTFGLLYHVTDSLAAADLALFVSGEFLFKLFRALEEKHKVSVRQSCSEKFVDREKYSESLSELWLKNLGKQHRLLRGAGKPLLTFLQPNQYVPGSKIPSPEERQIFAFKPPEEQEFWGRTYSRAVAKIMAGSQRNPNIIDLTMIFKDHPETMYKDDCCHVTNEANLFLFKAIQPYVLRELRLQKPLLKTP